MGEKRLLPYINTPPLRKHTAAAYPRCRYTAEHAAGLYAFFDATCFTLQAVVFLHHINKSEALPLPPNFVATTHNASPKAYTQKSSYDLVQEDVLYHT